MFYIDCAKNHSNDFRSARFCVIPGLRKDWTDILGFHKLFKTDMNRTYQNLK